MNPNLRKSLVGSAIVVMFASPVWSDQGATTSPDTIPRSDTTPQGDVVQPMESVPMQTAPGEAAPSTGAPAMVSPDTAVSGNPLYARTPEELRGVELVDVAGNKVGKVKTLVLDPDGQSAHAVISSGGFLGLGAREIVVSLDDLQLLDERLQINAPAENVLTRGSYEPDQYVELTPDRPISEFSAFEPIPD